MGLFEGTKQCYTTKNNYPTDKAIFKVLQTHTPELGSAKNGVLY